MWAQPALQEYTTRIWHRVFQDAGFDLQGGPIDVTLMIKAANEQGVRWDLPEAIQRKMTRGIEMGLGAIDRISTYEVTRAHAGLGTYMDFIHE